MGGAKKKTIAQMEKTQKIKEEREKSGPKKKGKVSEKKTAVGAISKLDEKTVLSELSKMKAITPSAVASQFGIRVGAAKEYLRELASRGIISMTAGCSRVKIYMPAT